MNYIEGLNSGIEKYKLSEAKMFHEFGIIQFVKKGDVERAIELAGSIEQLITMIAKRFMHDYEHLKSTFEYHQNKNNHWLSWGHRCYSDFEVFARERLPLLEEIIDYDGKDWFIKASQYL